jgi:hypothetical protein
VSTAHGALMARSNGAGDVGAAKPADAHHRTALNPLPAPAPAQFPTAQFPTRNAPRWPPSRPGPSSGST